MRENTKLVFGSPKFCEERCAGFEVSIHWTMPITHHYKNKNKTLDKDFRTGNQKYQKIILSNVTKTFCVHTAWESLLVNYWGGGGRREGGQN